MPATVAPPALSKVCRKRRRDGFSTSRASFMDSSLFLVLPGAAIAAYRSSCTSGRIEIKLFQLQELLAEQAHGAVERRCLGRCELLKEAPPPDFQVALEE